MNYITDPSEIQITGPFHHTEHEQNRRNLVADTYTVIAHAANQGSATIALLLDPDSSDGFNWGAITAAVETFRRQVGQDLKHPFAGFSDAAKADIRRNLVP